ncbi:hypothetical protein BH10PSE5_BH10PSE5_02640 [soil metagenome]
MATQGRHMAGHEAWFAAGGGMESVTGFISPRSARTFTSLLSWQLQAGLQGSLVEIGTYYGKTFVGMALAAGPQDRIIGVDVFPDDTAEVLVSHLNRVVPAGTVANVRFAKTDSRTVTPEAWAGLLEQPARFVHIDGDHAYEAVFNDIQLAASFLVEGGIVVIDDYLHDWFPDVTEGIIDGLRAAPTLHPVAVIPRSGPLMGGGTKLVCTTQHAVEPCFRLIQATLPELTFRAARIADRQARAFMNYD